MADDPATDDPRLLPFPAGDGGAAADSDDLDEDDLGEPDDDDTLSFGEGEDLETAYRRALAAVDEAGPRLTPEPPAAKRTADDSSDDGAPAEPHAPAASGERSTDPPVRVTPREVVEAALFVGGAGLTAERAGKLLRGTFTDADLAAAVAQLNRRYEAEGRPYRARAGEDGYALRLLPEYEPLRRRLYGLGPREVTLPPDVLETLSVVAYRQPITAANVERTRDKPSGGALRRLVRLGVLRIAKPDPAAEAGKGAGKDAGEKSEPTYATTDRFLDLFGLGSLDDLPVPADLRFK
ncbi:SMC-Scp complex subunit ScpB [Alienimonas californiensis]|uniref:Segregation and condensation protein B n=1 Tax=Alienimonas californiensis TaxID=2527989 RepID=A0A517P8J9_9PLAN|nr:SMC-Scp complex subunit ScpB [Alienimonas californiensis]QDT15694.1 hypothetical protein CA12_17840 [Alienimonas californiensis]